MQVVEGSPQTAEPAAVVRAFGRFQEPFCLITELVYVAGVTMRAGHCLLKEVSNPDLCKLLSRLVCLISHRKEPFYVMNVKSLTDLPGAIADGNRRADALAMPVGNANIPDIFAQAKLSHSFCHRNVPAIMRVFNLSEDQAKAIVATCPNCQAYQVPSVRSEVNPGASRVTSSGNPMLLTYHHLESPNMYPCQWTLSGAVFALALAEENTTLTIRHFLLAFATLGVPEQVKTDNGPAHTSWKLKDFCSQWGVKHKRGTSINPTGQSIDQRTHQTIRRVLDQQQRGTEILSPVERLCKVLYVINFLNRSASEPNAPYFGTSQIQPELSSGRSCWCSSRTLKHIKYLGLSL